MEYIYQPVDFAAHREPITDIHRRALSQVYFALFSCCLGTFAGVCLDTAYGSGGLNSAMRFCLAISWLNVIHQRRAWARVCCMISACVSFGATLGPSLSHFIDIDREYMKDFFMLCMISFLSHMLSIRWGQREMIHEVTTLTAPLVTALWITISKYTPQIFMNGAYFLVVSAMSFIAAAIGRRRIPVLGISIRIHLEFISLLSCCFYYNLVQLIAIYVAVLFFLVHLWMHTILTIALAAQVGGNDLIIAACVTFLTKFVGRSAYLAIDLGTRVAVLVYELLENVLAFE